MRQSLFNRLYYTCKPYLPWGLRVAVRRWVASRQRRRLADVWPILPAASRAPAGWPGWPDGKRFALVLTHDIEGARGLDGCRPLAQLEMDLGFRSSFNFVPEGDYETPPSLRAWLGEHGFEVGVHDLNHDGWLYRDREDFRRKAARINRYLEEWGSVGFRSGFMHHNYEWLHDLRVQYDSSSFDTDPFEPQPDGILSIFPFWMENPLPGDGRSGYVELPYTLPQDSTLFLLFNEPGIDVWVRKLDWIAEHGGMALLNVHPDYVQFSGMKSAANSYPAAHYEAFLRAVKARHGGQYWAPLPRDVARFVQLHQQVCRNPHLDGAGRLLASPSIAASFPSRSTMTAPKPASH